MTARRQDSRRLAECSPIGKETTLPDFQPPAGPAADLDLAKLGETVVRLGTIAVFAGHTNLRLTLRDYVHPDPANLELRFLRDLLLLSPEECADRWYGGKLEAIVFGQQYLTATQPPFPQQAQTA